MLSVDDPQVLARRVLAISQLAQVFEELGEETPKETMPKGPFTDNKQHVSASALGALQYSRYSEVSDIQPLLDRSA